MTVFESQKPSMVPSMVPSYNPSMVPSVVPSVDPTDAPSLVPSTLPSDLPSMRPSSGPSFAPSGKPTRTISDVPSRTPSAGPSAVPSKFPSMSPTFEPILGLADTTLRGGIYATYDQSSYPYVVVQNNAPEQTGLMKFQLPIVADVNGLFLILAVSDEGSNEPLRELSLKVLTNPVNWDEATVTYNTFTAAGPTYGSTTVTYLVPPNTAGAPNSYELQIDITALKTEILASSNANNGKFSIHLEVTSPSGPGAIVKIASLENSVLAKPLLILS